MLTTFALCAALGAPSYVIDWTTTQTARSGQRVQESSELTLEEGQVFKRVEKVGKKHLRMALALRLIELDDERVRLEGSLRSALDPQLFDSVVLTATLDNEIVLRSAESVLGTPMWQVRVRVHRTGAVGPIVARVR